MKLFSKFWWTALILFLSAPVIAGDVTYQTISSAAQKSNDLSRQAMVMIFGEVVVHPFQEAQTTLIGSLFAILNGVLAACAFFWFASTFLRGLVKAGHEGRMFGAGRSTLYPIMTLSGFMMIVPTKSGWSLAQLMMLWATSVMGIGSANLLTDKAVDMMNSGYSMVTQPTAASTRAAARGIFEMSLCKYANNSELQMLYRDGVARTPMMSTRGGNGEYTIANGSALCGSVKTPDTGRTGTLNSLFDSQADTSGIVKAQRQALDTMVATLDQAASAFVTTYLSRRDHDTGTFADAETQIQNAAAAYENTVNQAINSVDFKDTLQSQLSSQIKSSGWVALGSWYMTFATANSKTNSVASASPIVSGMSHLGETGTGDLYPGVMAAYGAQLQNSTYTAPLGTQTSKDDASAASATDPNAALIGFFSKPMQTITNQLATWNIGSSNDFSNQVNPLIKMQTIGEYTIGAAELSITAFAGTYAVASAASNSTVGFATKIMAVDTGAVVKDTMDALKPMFYFFMWILIGIGFILAVYIPVVPFLFWMTGVVNWIVSVLVGCAAGPLWAATHLGAEEDKGSRSTYGYIFLIDMMIRPLLMVLGFFFASVSASAAGTLLNMLYASALASANADSFVGVIKMAGWLMIYARISTFMVTRLFGLQATLPDYVISFLGGRDGANLMGGMADNVKGMFGSATAGAQRTPGVASTSKNLGNENSGKDGIQ